MSFIIPEKHDLISSSFNSTHMGPPRHHYRRFSAYEILPKSILIGAANAPDSRNDRITVAAFSYDPAHLQAWHMQPELAKKLPAEMLPHLAAMQRAGAAVLTSFERLRDIQEDLEEDEERRRLEKQESKRAMLRPTPPIPHGRRRRSCSATPEVDEDAVSISTGATAGSGSVSCSSIGSASSDGTSRTTIPSSASSTIALTAAEKPPVLPSFPASLSNSSGSSSSSASSSTSTASKKRYSTHSTPLTTLTIPMESTPARCKYSAERYHLRTEALVRLSHCVRGIDRELCEYSRGEDESESNFITCKAMDELVYDEFEQWYRGKKAAVRALVERGRALEGEKFSDEL